MSESCNSCNSNTCSSKNKQSNESDQEFMDRQALASRMCKIKHKIIVLSGKGGVGKSTVAANIAASLSKSGKKVGILDVDIHGPSIPRMIGVNDSKVPHSTNETIIMPVKVSENLIAMSIGFLLADKDDALIWRGPMKIGVIKQFLKDVEWGELDYLVIDLPPGTGDEPLSIAQMIDDPDGAVIVTTPQEVALADVRKSINFCHKLEMPILGVVENMSGFACPKCGEVTDIFKKGGAEQMCLDMKVAFAGRIPLTAEIVHAGDSGSIMQEDSETNKLFEPIIKALCNV